MGSEHMRGVRGGGGAGRGGRWPGGGVGRGGGLAGAGGWLGGGVGRGGRLAGCALDVRVIYVVSGLFTVIASSTCTLCSADSPGLVSPGGGESPRVKQPAIRGYACREGVGTWNSLGRTGCVGRRMERRAGGRENAWRAGGAGGQGQCGQGGRNVVHRGGRGVGDGKEMTLAVGGRDAVLLHEGRIGGASVLVHRTFS